MQFDHLESGAKFPNEYGYTIGPQNNKKIQSSTQGFYSNREKLLNIHKREMLKGLLVNKFKAKYATDKRPQLQMYINNEVHKFLSNERLSEDNLKRLDDKIAKEADTRERKDTILEDRKSIVSNLHVEKAPTFIPDLVRSPLSARGSDRASQISSV